MFSIVRDRQRVWPYCIECGCRLKVLKHLHDKGEKNAYGEPALSLVIELGHFPHKEIDNVDGRGHSCKFIEAATYVWNSKTLVGLI